MVGVGSKLHLDNVSSTLENTRNDIRPQFASKSGSSISRQRLAGIPLGEFTPRVSNNSLSDRSVKKGMPEEPGGHCGILNGIK